MGRKIRRADAIHAFEGELCRRDAHYLRLGAASLSSDDCSGDLETAPQLLRDRSRAFHGWPHYVALAAMIFFFSYFWVATQFQPTQIADTKEIQGGYIPGVRRWKLTADFS